MRQREEDREIKRQPGQPLPGERGREKGGKPEMEPEKPGHQGVGSGNLPPSGQGSAVE
jgi:hypothetical protein